MLNIDTQSHLYEWAHVVLARMHGAACIELPKLPDGVDGWKIQQALHDITGWMQARITHAHLFYIGIDDFGWHQLKCINVAAVSWRCPTQHR